MGLATIAEHFGELEDPRCGYLVEHRLLDIVTIALCAVLAGADSWVEVAAFGRAREGWLRTFLELPAGIPAHDTFGRVFARLDPQGFARGFRSWVGALRERLGLPGPPEGEAAGEAALRRRLRAIDGKQLRRSHDRLAGHPALHVVSVWAAEARLVLAQQAVADKSNEITALPVLLRQLDLAGCLVTIDAMGCQRAVAAQLVEQGADYVLALKANQEGTYEAVADAFATAEADGYAGVRHDRTQARNKGHGRREWRRATVIDDPAMLAWLGAGRGWSGLRAVGRVEAQRRVGEHLGDVETRYYLLSEPLTAAAFGQAVRAHWGIENGEHWVLDIAFREDESRVRVGHAPLNFALLRRLALNLLSRDRRGAGGTKAKRLQAAWDPDYLLHLLGEL
ncbi:MAG: ISAs1 family transposase [Steroidobacteraceae bacterium]